MEGKQRYSQASFRACRAPAISMPRGATQVLRASVVVEVEGGHGSGVLISPDGLVLTAAHVVRSTQVADVRLQDGARLKAALIRIDPEADVALLKLPATSSPTSCLALRQTAVGTGEEIYAVGAPLDRSLAFSLTRGIVSGTREVRGATLLQTDASVNAGNSGGPLVDGSGRAVGIVRSKAVGTGIEGVAFGVPIMVAAPGENTDGALLQTTASRSTEAPAVVDDVADDLHPVYRPPVAVSAPAQAVSARREASPSERIDWRHWRKIGWGLGAAGAGAVVGSTLAYALSHQLTQGRFDTLRAINDGGWIVAAGGLGLVISSYVFDDAPARRTARASIGVGPGSISVAGAF